MTINRTHLAGLELARSSFREWLRTCSGVYGKKLDGLIAQAQAAPEAEPVALSVWYGSMPESNGKSNWTAILYRKGEGWSEGITIDRGEYPDRVRYEADCMRFLIGELAGEPDILDYDAEAHSGYTAPQHDAELVELLDRLHPYVRGCSAELWAEYQSKLATLKVKP